MIGFRSHTDAVIATLVEAGLKVGDAVAPGTDPKTEAPYVIVYPVTGMKSFAKNRSGSLAEPFEDAELVYQVTCVATSRRSAELLADKTEVLLEGVVVDGRRIHVIPDMNPGINRNDNETPPIFEAMPRYKLMTTPAALKEES